MPTSHSEQGQNGRIFVTTRWSLVQRASVPSSPESGEALEWLCQRYWWPLYAFVRSKGYPPADSEDLVQGFFARFLERNFVADADAERGRFRSFLLGCLHHYLQEQQRHAGRHKRGGGLTFIALGDPNLENRLEAQLADQQTPEATFDRQWAVTLLERALDRLQQEGDADDHPGRFERIKPYLTGGGDEPQTALAADLKCSVNAVRLLLYRMRQRYRELVRDEVAQTVNDPAEIDAELKHLYASLRS